MSQLSIYQQLEFPTAYKWQAIAFMRTEWSSIFYDDNLYMSETYPPELEPVHFVLAEDDSLLSYASLLKLNLTHAEFDYQIYGFGNLLTFPPARLWRADPASRDGFHPAKRSRRRRSVL